MILGPCNPVIGWREIPLTLYTGAGVGSHPLGQNKARRYDLRCSCGWVGPVCADKQHALDLCAKHVTAA